MIARLRALWQRLQVTLPLRAWKRYSDLRGNRLAGASSFYGFVSLFPLLVLGAAVASAVAGPSGVQTVQEIVDENLPGLGVDVGEFRQRAGTIGVIGAGTLLFTGLGWVDSVRAAVRSMWGIDDRPGNLFARKAIDVAALAGLGLLILVSWGASVVVVSFAGEVLDWLGLTAGGWMLRLVSALVSIGVSTALFGYLLSGLPRIVVPLPNLLVVSLLGAVVFEVLKQFLVQVVTGGVARTSFAAFAAPLAMLAWIYLVTRLMMVLAAITAESAIDELGAAESAGTAMRSAERGPMPPLPQAGAELSPGQVRATGMAAGAVLGAAGLALAVLTARAARAAASALRRPPSE